MKKFILITLFAIILLTACSSKGQVIALVQTPQETSQLHEVIETEILPSRTPTLRSTATKTPITPTITTNPTITPTLSLPVSLNTPVPISNVRIKAENVSELIEIARFYGDTEFQAKLTRDRKFVFILDPEGITKYAYEGMESIRRVELINSATNLQMSDDGSVMIIDGWWLDWRNGSQPKPTLLSDLLEIEAHSTTLSPDGSLIAAQRLYCKDICDHVLWIVSTKDFRVLHKETGQSVQEHPTFSSDGKYLAIAETFLTAYPSGKVERSGALARVWRISDFTVVSNIRLKYPFWVTDMAFAPDNVTLAIANLETVDVYNGISSERLAIITGLCDDYYHTRRIMFAPTTPLTLLENGCSSNIWAISGTMVTSLNRKAPAFSTIFFDESRNIKPLSLPFQVEARIKKYRLQYFLKFISNNIITFKNFESENLNKYLCEFSLNESSFYCKTSTQVEINDHPYEKDTILGSNGGYYTYIRMDSTVKITSAENPGQNYYSIPFLSNYFNLQALDPKNQIILYHKDNSGILQDMSNDRILHQWDGAISSAAFSENKKYIAFCQKLQTSTNHPNRDKLAIFDLITKKIVYYVTFTCIGENMAFSTNGEKFAVIESYIKPGNSFYSSRLVMINNLTPYDKKSIDLVEGFRGGITFSPDNSFIAVNCTSTDICFFDVITGEKIYQLKARVGIENLAFSPDGTYLAVSSNLGSISIFAIPPLEIRSYDSKKETVSELFLPTKVPTTDTTHAAFFTGWEDGQPNGFIDLVYESKNVTGYFNSNEPQPEASPRGIETAFTKKMAPDGGHKYLMVSGYCQQVPCFINYLLFKPHIKVREGMKLSYWIYILSNSSGPTLAIDGRFDNGSTIRDFNKNIYLTDQNGIRIHPIFQGIYEPGSWRYVEIDLSPGSGLILESLMVSYENAEINDYTGPGTIRGYIDNLYIGPGNE